MIIILDVDGTIMDAMPSYTKTFSKILSKYEIPESITREFFEKSAGTELYDQLKIILENNKKSFDDATIKQLIEDFWADQQDEMPHLYPDVIPNLDILKNYEIHLATGTRQDVLDRRVEHFKLSGYFKNWVGWSEKNSKWSHVEALSKNNQCVLVADSISDMSNSKKLGITAIGIVREGGLFTKKELEESGADFIINDFSPLREIIQGLESTTI